MNRTNLDIFFGILAAWLVWKHIVRPKAMKIRTKIKDYAKHLRHIHNMNKDIYGEDLNNLLINEIESCQAIRKDKEKNKEELATFFKDSQEKMKEKIPPKKFEFWADNLDVLLVAFSLAFAVRALFLQPFKIPTSSMQPTLHGVNIYDDSYKDPELEGLTEAQYIREKYGRNVSKSSYSKGRKYEANKLRAFLDSLYYGQQYGDIVTTESGQLVSNDKGGVKAQAVSMKDMAVKRIGFPLVESYSRIQIGKKEYIVPIPWHKLDRDQEKKVLNGVFFKPGNTIFSGVSEDGDHLFVNRMVYNFRNPKRGDISVFMTDKISDKGQRLSGQFYIKRLVGLPNETIRIKNKKVYKVIDGKEEALSKSDHPCFEKIYSFTNGYHGHQRAFPDGYNDRSRPKLFKRGDDIYAYNTAYIKTDKGYVAKTDSKEPVWFDHLPKVEKDQIILHSDYQQLYFKDLFNGNYVLTDIVRKDGYEAHYGTDYDEYKLGKNQYFMLGDNSNSSLDSRYWGPVPRKSLIGTAASVFWPFSHRWGMADNNELKSVKTKKRGKY